jgi:biopolymer transport protein ExbD
MAKRRSKLPEGEIETNVVPIMSIMFLLVPALLLAMEVARFAAIEVSPPRACGLGSPTVENADPLHLKVVIREDGYRLAARGQQLGSTPRRAIDSDAPTIPLAKPGVSLDDFDRYDYARLEARAAELKRSSPLESTVTVSAEAEIPYQVLTRTLDALRGRACRPGGAGEATPPECIFMDPIIES